MTRLDLPHGSFNAGLVANNDPLVGTYICVYRPDEHSFRAVYLDENFNFMSSPVDLGITNCADPRLVWFRGELILVYSSYDTGFQSECIRGAVLLGWRETSFRAPVKPFRISEPSSIRQKNWVPFVSENRFFLVGSTKPHTIYEMPEIGCVARMCCETDWNAPWFSPEFMRGNTNPVQLADGNFLGTFHTVQKNGQMHYYDNGCYVFEPTPPFRVIRCANRTYLPAEAAVEPHFRKAGIIQVCFPVGMVRSNDRLLISYGDNDSSVKIMDTTVQEMVGTTLEIY